jgi:hypothetical protein
MMLFGPLFHSANKLQMAILEFEHREPLFDVEERRPETATRVLSGSLFPFDSTKICRCLTFKTGIGTYTIPQTAKPMMEKLHKVMDTMLWKNPNVYVMGEYFNRAFPVSPTTPNHPCYVRWIWISRAQLSVFVFSLLKSYLPYWQDEAGDKIFLFGEVFPLLEHFLGVFIHLTRLL